jgi:hypothetical protein
MEIISFNLTLFIKWMRKQYHSKIFFINLFEPFYLWLHLNLPSHVQSLPHKHGESTS